MCFIGNAAPPSILLGRALACGGPPASCALGRRREAGSLVRQGVAETTDPTGATAPDSPVWGL